MRALAIDTSTDRAGVALCEGATCVARTAAEAPEIASPAPQHAERVLGILDDLLQKARWSKSDIELLACSLGPGSFTGVRVGVATAKGIALALDIPIVGVGSLEVMAHAFRRSRATRDPNHATIALLDARKGEVFWAAYADDGALLAGPGHVAAASAGALAKLADRPKVTFVGEIAGRLDLGGAPILATRETDRPDPAVLAELGVSRFEGRGADDLDALEPAYVRPPDITLPAASS
jgi:tRNA threonylcarbamoyladenosine biosynthesis protein TsaB